MYLTSTCLECVLCCASRGMTIQRIPESWRAAVALSTLCAEVRSAFSQCCCSHVLDSIALVFLGTVLGALGVPNSELAVGFGGVGLGGAGWGRAGSGEVGSAATSSPSLLWPLCSCREQGGPLQSQRRRIPGGWGMSCQVEDAGAALRFFLPLRVVHSWH